jgi:hypothetical protein
MQVPQSACPTRGWWKSSYSGATNNNCVLVNRTDRCWITGDAPRNSAVLAVPFREWAAFLHEVRRGLL